MNKACKILAVDDNHVNRLLIKKILEERGMEVVTACNGSEAVEKEAEQLFDLILMDLQMPVMDGFEATQIIRQNAFKIPILALSANVSEENILRCKEVGMNDFHEKPFQKKQLIEYVEKWI